MLSKIKTSSVATETRSAAIAASLAAAVAAAAASNGANSDNEDEQPTTNQMNQMTTDVIGNDTNNNSNQNNKNNQQQQQQSSKKSQDELLDIVEVSRKRRLSKDSADSLNSFIRWSFGHVNEASDHHHRSISSSLMPKFGSKTAPSDELNEDLMLNEEGEEEEEEEVDDEDWSGGFATRHQQYLNNNNNSSHNHNHNQCQRSQQQQLSAEQMLLRRHAKLAQDGSSSAANLAALIKSEHRLTSAQLLAAESADRASKRARTQQVYSPESKFLAVSQSGAAGGAQRKSSNHLGNVVERLHQQQQQQRQQQQEENQQTESDQELGSNASLSFHLQQFLQQQTSLEDLCSSVGLDDSNQLVLAAAIHRALVDSVGPGGGGAGGAGGGGGGSSCNQLGGADTKSVASSTGSSHSGASSSNNNSVSSNGSSVANLGQTHGSNANLHLVDSLVGNRLQSRAYNTRAALHGLSSAANGSLNQNRQSAVVAALGNAGGGGGAGAMNMSNRTQQQRHAQAAAALSALAASASSNHHQHHHQQLSTSGTPIVDFECDTCGSSFDDRHRLMQHQSIHLELKKDWFTETPVDEVMKIFNRRRGEFLCNTCNLRFEATFDYDKHNHSVHGQRPYCCQFCGNGTRTFRFWRQYLNHLYDHRYIFSCTIDDCDFTVNRRDSLRFHIFRFHLNCQLPQNQHQQLRADLMLGSNNNNNNNNNSNYNNNNNNIVSKWSALEEEDVNDNEMNVGE